MSKMQFLLHALVESFKRRGIFTIILIFHEIFFDWKYGLNTSSIVMTKDDRTIISENKKYSFDYMGTNPYLLRKIFSDLKIEFEQSTFIDFGSGKGRVLLVASEYGFKRIIGVEFSEDLNKICQSNISRYQNKCLKRPSIEVIHGDAAEYEVPNEASVFFFFNPFNDQVMIKVLDRIRKSLMKNYRRITIIYVNPLYTQLIEQFGYRRKSCIVLNKRRLSCEAVIYSNVI